MDLQVDGGRTGDGGHCVYDARRAILSFQMDARHERCSTDRWWAVEHRTVRQALSSRRPVVANRVRQYTRLHTMTHVRVREECKVLCVP